MSLENLASKLARKGRNGDDVLVHMTRGEVAGLDALARAHGTRLTRNPDTGLPEAFSLKSLLPTLAGAALTYFSGGAINPYMSAAIVGGARGVQSGSLSKGLMAGLGAYGGASLAGGAVNATVDNATQGAVAPGATEATRGYAQQQFANMPAAEQLAQTSNVTGDQYLQAMGGGSETAKAGMMALAPSAVEAMTPEQQERQRLRYDIYDYEFDPEARNVSPQTSREYARFGNRFNLQGTRTGYAAEGGIMRLAQGGVARFADGGESRFNQYQYDPVTQQYSREIKGDAIYGAPVPTWVNTQDGYGGSLTIQQDIAPLIGYKPSTTEYSGGIQALTPQPATPIVGGYNPTATYGATPTGYTPASVGATGYSPVSVGATAYNPAATYAPPVQAAHGGAMHSDLGDYSDGARLLRGPGDGVSDDIPATIGGKRPARLADGEFVVPARVVSELGNGSTEAGAKQLYAMMDRIQKGRSKSIGKNKVAVDSKAHKYLPA